MSSLNPALRRARLALGAFFVVLVVGSVGYWLLGFSVLDACYQTVTTVTTVGFREVRPLSSTGKIFTIVLILAGVGTALYTLSLLLEAVVEGHLLEHMEARRMERAIARMRNHVIICGFGRVGRASAAHLSSHGERIVVIDRDAARLEGITHAHVIGDLADDDVLRSAGIADARALLAALETDADNVYVALSARALRPDLVIIARARSDESTSKLLRAGADRVVNRSSSAANRWRRSRCTLTRPFPRHRTTSGERVLTDGWVRRRRACADSTSWPWPCGCAEALSSWPPCASWRGQHSATCYAGVTGDFTARCTVGD